MLPFGESENDPYAIYEIIVKRSLSFPKYFNDKKAKKFITLLLNKVPEARMIGGSYASLKANPWFDNFDWDSLLDNKMTPPYIPPENKLLSNN